MQIGKVYKLKIDQYDMNGSGIAKQDGVVVFVEQAMDGETVLAEITHVHKRYAFAKTRKVLESNPHRLVSPCPYFDACGGCDLLHMDYQTECQIKTKKVTDAISKIAKLRHVKINPLISSDNLLGYRNKILVPFGKDDDQNVIYGFYQKQTHELISIDHCAIANHYAGEVLEFIRRYISIFNISVYDETHHEGIVRAVMIRNNVYHQMMVVLIVTKAFDCSELVAYLEQYYPLVQSVYLNINAEKTNVMLSDHYVHLFGSKTITEDILGLKYNVSAASFMQVNHDQCERLYAEAYRMAQLKPFMTVIDAYCGMGSITLGIAKKVKHVYGIEIVAEAIENAKVNQQLNQIANVTFLCGKCEDVIVDLAKKTKIDVIFFDPPRKGCDTTFLKTVVSMQIPRIVYISCNIATACRDVNYLIEHGYILKEVTPVDLFSKTSHVESIFSLVLSS